MPIQDGVLMGAMMPFGSGSYFDFEHPEQSEMTIEDVAWGLAHTCRFRGQTVEQATGKRVFYSVAEHCWLMSYVVHSSLAYDALMHELGEVTCGDMIGTAKFLVPDYVALEKRCGAAAAMRFGVANRDPAAIKIADLRMLATERRDLMPPSKEIWRFLVGVEPYDNFRIYPMTAQVAAEQFLSRWRNLAPDNALDRWPEVK